jgi:hypothetical protein
MRKKMKRLTEKVPRAVWFAVVFVAVCMAAGAEEADTWAPVTRTNQIAGTWEGTTVFTVPSGDKQVMPDMPMAMVFTLRYTEDAEDMEMAIKLDFSQFLNDWSAFIGISVDALWEILSLNFKGESPGDGVEMETGAYFVSFKNSYGPVDAVTGNNEKLFINTDGTRLKLNLDDFSPSGMDIFASPDGMSEFILYRQ